MEDKFDIDGIEAEPDTPQEFYLKAVEMHSLILALINDIPTASHINVNLSIPELLTNVEVDINAPGLKEAINLAMHLVIS